MFKAGFVNIYGYPNAGKSTLLNSIMDYPLAIVSHKAQSSRYRIQGFYNTENAQVVFSDTPGFLTNPRYLLHQKMLAEIMQATEDGNLSLLLVDIKDLPERIAELLRALPIPAPIFLVLNKIDSLTNSAKLQERVELFRQFFSTEQRIEKILPISAFQKQGLEDLLNCVLDYMPEGEPFYDQESLCNVSERFLVAEMIREQIFALYSEELPYHSAVIIDSFKDKGEVIVIFAYILVQRVSQKAIILGRGGQMIKSLGINARHAIEKLLRKKVYLDLSVKVQADWRKNEALLKKLGYTA